MQLTQLYIRQLEENLEKIKQNKQVSNIVSSGNNTLNIYNAG